MTRGEALLAMEGGARVDGFYHGKLWRFWLDGTEIDSNYEAGASKSDLFLLCSDFKIVPEPDTAEKFVRDSIPLLQQMGELKSLESAALVLGIVVRGKALIQQMDGEK